MSGWKEEGGRVLEDGIEFGKKAIEVRYWHLLLAFVLGFMSRCAVS